MSEIVECVQCLLLCRPRGCQLGFEARSFRGRLVFDPCGVDLGCFGCREFGDGRLLGLQRLREIRLPRSDRRLDLTLTLQSSFRLGHRRPCAYRRHRSRRRTTTSALG